MHNVNNINDENILSGLSKCY